jgi:hypothetical protein
VSGRKDNPKRPADAYNAVAPLIPPKLFLTPPPAQGTRIVVTGPDGVATQWDLAEPVAAAVVSTLRSNPRVVVNSATPYDDNRGAAA